MGHQLGDKVLKSVAGTVRDTIRISDQIFRYGGEEYVVILSRVNAKTATQLADKICRQVEKDYFVDGDKKFQVAISIGGVRLSTKIIWKRVYLKEPTRPCIGLKTTNATRL